WKIVPHPSPGRNSLLNGVAAVSPRNVWAVGTYAAAYRYSDRTLVLHWDGTTWKRIPSPHPGFWRWGSQLSGVAAVSAQSGWAGGVDYDRGPKVTLLSRTLVLRWNGKQWRRVRSTRLGGGAFYDVAVVGRRNVWAVGASQNGREPPLVEHWNGHS